MTATRHLRGAGAAIDAHGANASGAHAPPAAAPSPPTSRTESPGGWRRRRTIGRRSSPRRRHLLARYRRHGQKVPARWDVPRDDHAPASPSPRTKTQAVRAVSRVDVRLLRDALRYVTAWACVPRRLRRWRRAIRIASKMNLRSDPAPGLMEAMCRPPHFRRRRGGWSTAHWKGGQRRWMCGDEDGPAAVISFGTCGELRRRSPRLLRALGSGVTARSMVRTAQSDAAHRPVIRATSSTLASLLGRANRLSPVDADRVAAMIEAPRAQYEAMQGALFARRRPCAGWVATGSAARPAPIERASGRTRSCWPDVGTATGARLGPDPRKPPNSPPRTLRAAVAAEILRAVGRDSRSRRGGVQLRRRHQRSPATARVTCWRTGGDKPAVSGAGQEARAVDHQSGNRSSCSTTSGSSASPKRARQFARLSRCYADHAIGAVTDLADIVARRVAALR